MLIHHYTNVDSFEQIMQCGKILPVSPKSSIAQMPILGKLLPSSHKEKGVYGIRDKDIHKWNSDSFALNHFAQIKSGGGTLIDIIFELSKEMPMEILEEKILYYEVLPFADKNSLQGTSSIKFLFKLPSFGFEGLKLYNKYVNSSVILSEYSGKYVLPVVFMKYEIDLKNSIVDIRYMDYKKKFKRI